ncbi:hypothetical protein ES703_61301 [subsurface metagenome]
MGKRIEVKVDKFIEKNPEIDAATVEHIIAAHIVFLTAKKKMQSKPESKDCDINIRMDKLETRMNGMEARLAFCDKK